MICTQNEIYLKKKNCDEISLQQYGTQENMWQENEQPLIKGCFLVRDDVGHMLVWEAILL